MKLSDVSIHRPVFAVMLMSAMCLFGFLGYRGLGISQYPDVEFPVCTVTTILQGASPEVMENDVTEVVEKAVASVQGVRSITSQSVQGVSVVTIEFELSRSIDEATQDVRDKVAGVVRNLPTDIDPPIISKVNPQDSPIMWVATYGTLPYRDVSDFADNVLADRLQVVKGVGDITSGARQTRQVRIWVDPMKMEAYGLTVEDVSRALSRQHLETPSGRIESRMVEFNVRILGEMESVQQLNKVVVTKKQGSPVYLEDIAIVEDGLEDKRTIARFNGLRAAGLGIRKQRGENTVAVARAVKAELEKVKKELPEGLQVSVAFDSSLFIEEAIQEIQFTMIFCIILTAIICYFFLLSFRSTIVIALAMPVSIIGTFGFMYFFGFTLNTLTLLGISLSVGVVVDDAIIVLENIYRHREMGEGPMEAALNGASGITFAALAATLAIVAIFLPVAFMKGIIGRFFFEFGITVSVAILLSYVVALSLTPMLCSRFLNVGSAKNWFTRRMDRMLDGMAPYYGRMLPFCIKHRFLVCIVSIVIFCLSLFFIKILGKEFVPSEDQSRFLINIICPVGSSVDYTDQMVRKCEEIVSSQPEVKGYFTATGIGRERLANRGIMFVTLVPADERKRTQQELVLFLRKEFSKFAGMKAVPIDLSTQGFTAQRGYPIEFSIQGPDLNRLVEISSKMMFEMGNVPGIIDIDSNYDIGMPEVQVIPDRKKAADMGVDSQKIGETLNALVGGIDVAKFKDRGKRYDINMRLQAQSRKTPDAIGDLKVRNDQNELVPLRDLVTIRERPSLLVINRYNRQRAITVTGNVSAELPQEQALKEVEKIAKTVLPPGYQIEFSGVAKTFQESFQSLVFALVMGIIVAYMILAAQFNHFIHPITVLVALPFSLTGALVALWLTGGTLNIYSMIGLILLMGLVKKNSIILVDYTNQLRDAGKSRYEALLEACPVRLRPILMTSFSTIIGAVPVALHIGPGAESRAPMAITIIGGVLFSTFLTLFVVPVIYTYLDDLSEKLKPLFRHKEHH